MSLLRLIIIGVFMELLYLSFYFVSESPNEVLLFIGVNAVAFVLYALLVYQLQKSEMPASNNLMYWIVGFGILFRLTLIFHLPVGSDDIYRYVWDGKVAAHGINPFAYAPTDSSLNFLHTDVLPAKMNFPHMRALYPPLAQALFFISNRLFGDSISGLKLLLVLADILAILLLVQLSRSYDAETLRPALRGSGFGVAELSTLIYSWSPLPVMYFGLDGHVDALGIPFLLLFLYLIAKNKHIAAASSLGLSVLAKLYPLFVVPFLFSTTNGWKKIFLPVIPLTLLIISYWLYWEPTGGLFESFVVFNSTFEFNGSVFQILYAILQSNQKAHLASTFFFVFFVGCIFVIKRPMLDKVFLAFLGFFVFAPVVQPWYLTWLAALISLRWSTAVFVLLGLSNLSNLTVYQYRMNGIWQDNSLVLLIEYLPFYCLLFWEIVRGKFSVFSTTPVPSG